MVGHGEGLGTKPKKRDGRVLSEEKWSLLVESFVTTVGNYSQAAKLAGVDHKTARKAWNEGYPQQGKRPIKELVEEIQHRARAATADAEVRALEKVAADSATRRAEDAEKARRSVIETRREEANIVRGERANVMGLIAFTGVIMGAAMERAQVIAKAIQSGIDPVSNEKLTLRDQISILRELAKLVRSAGESAMDVVKVERLLLGEPTEIVKTKIDVEGLENAIAEMERAGEAAARVKAKRERLGLKLITGGHGMNGAGSKMNGASA